MIMLERTPLAMFLLYPWGLWRPWRFWWNLQWRNRQWICTLWSRTVKLSMLFRYKAVTEIHRACLPLKRRKEKNMTTLSPNGFRMKNLVKPFFAGQTLHWPRTKFTPLGNITNSKAASCYDYSSTWFLSCYDQKFVYYT